MTPMLIKYVKIFSKLLLVLGIFLAVNRFCYVKTDGFALYKIVSPFAFNPHWEVPSQSTDGLQEIFDQPFHYLARGAQSYVFLSEDGRTVIKFFRLYHLRPPLWMTALTLPLTLQPFRMGKMLEKWQELDKNFQSYRIACEDLKEETGLLYLHLNKTSHLKKTLTLYDKIGVVHHIDLDQMEFLVQKRADLVYPTIDALVKTEGADAAKEAITSLLNLLYQRSQKGIFDKDPDICTNFGFIGKTPVQIDIGRFRRQAAPKNPKPAGMSSSGSRMASENGWGTTIPTSQNISRARYKGSPFPYEPIEKNGSFLPHFATADCTPLPQNTSKRERPLCARGDLSKPPLPSRLGSPRGGLQRAGGRSRPRPALPLSGKRWAVLHLPQR